MNIWIFNHYVAGPGDFGITRHFDLGKQLVKNGHNVTIFASSFNHWERKEKKEYPKNSDYIIEYHDDVKFIWFKTKPYKKNNQKRILNILSYYAATRKFNYNKLEESPDVVVGSLMHHLAAWTAYKVAKKYNARFIFEERDLWPESLVHLAGISRKNLIVKLLGSFESFMYKKAYKIIVLFDRAHIYVESKGIEKEKIVYLPNGLDFKFANHVNEELEIDSHREYLKDKVVIGYAGSHSRANNMERLVNLAEKFKNYNKYCFVFVGEGSYKKDMKRLINVKKLDNCLFLNPVSKENLHTVLNSFDYGIISLKDSPLYEWGFSLNKLYDYMAASLPIVMDTTLQHNIINENQLGFTSNNLDELKERIINTTENEYNTMGRNAKEYLELNHDWYKLSGRFEKEVLNS